MLLCCRHRCVQITIGNASNTQSTYETPGPLGHVPVKIVSVLAVLCRPPTNIAQVSDEPSVSAAIVVLLRCSHLWCCDITSAMHVKCIRFYISANMLLCACVQDYVPCSASLLHVPLKGASVSAALRLPSDLVSGRNLPVIFIVARELMLSSRIALLSQHTFIPVTTDAFLAPAHSNSTHMCASVGFLTACVTGAGHCMDVTGIGVPHGKQLAPNVTMGQVLALLRPNEAVLWGSHASVRQTSSMVGAHLTMRTVMLLRACLLTS